MPSANEILIKVTADNAQLKSKLKETEKEIEKTADTVTTSSSKITQFMSKIGAAAVAYIGVQTVTAAVDAAKELVNLEQGFKNLASSAEGGAEGLMQAVETASKGLISQRDIMKSANLAIQLMGEEALQNLPKMAEIAAGIAMAQGKDAKDLLNDIVVAAGRQSVLILDNLGISSARAGELMEEYARSLGKTREQLTETERKAAFFYATMKAGEETLQASGGITENFGTAVEKLNAKWSNLKDSTLKLLLPLLSSLVDIITAIVDGVQWLVSGFDALIKKIASNKYLLSFLSIIPGMQPIAMGMHAKQQEERQPIAKTQKKAIQELPTATQVKSTKVKTEEQKAVDVKTERIVTAEDFVKDRKMQYAVDELANAFGRLEDASKNAIYNMLWGKNSWSEFQKALSQMLKQLVADIIYLTLKVIALNAVMAAMPLGMNMAGGGLVTRVLSKIFERGYMPPVYAKGRIPAYPQGYVPADHFLAYIGTKEAVMRKEATQANRDILAWMNANAGQRYPGEIKFTSVVTLDGKEIGRAVDSYRDNVASLTGMQNYYKRSAYK